MGGRSPRGDGSSNCAHFSGPEQHICLAPAKLRTAKKHQKLTNGNEAVKKSNITIVASKTGRENHGKSNRIAVMCFCSTFVVTQNHVEGLYWPGLRSPRRPSFYFPCFFFSIHSDVLLCTHFGLPIMAALLDTCPSLER